jgi:GTP-binding protein
MAGRFQFLTSATQVSESPSDIFPEIAVLGRSNAGKSSLINAWTGSQLAKISGSPGKTRLINFFQGPKYRLVDFPGYGFSSRSGHEQASWAGMIESFLASRGNLVGALLVIDSRREWTQDEVLLVRFLQKIRKPVAVVLTKSDKLNRSEENSVRQKYKVLPGVEAIYFVSSLKRTGLKELEEGVFRAWIATSAGAST